MAGILEKRVARRKERNAAAKKKQTALRSGKAEPSLLASNADRRAFIEGKKERKAEATRAVPRSKGSKRNLQARKNRNAQRMGDMYAATGLSKKPGTSATKSKPAPAKPKSIVTRAKVTSPKGGMAKKTTTPKKSSVTLMTPAAAKKARQAKMDMAVKKGRTASTSPKKKGGKNLKGYDSYKSFMG